MGVEWWERRGGLVVVIGDEFGVLKFEIGARC